MTDYRSYFRQETICAIITPPGIGGVAVVRISGPLAKDVVQKVFSKDPYLMGTHTVNWGKILFPDGSLIDEGLCLYMKGPQSFTGEDVIELQFHGSHFIAQNVVESLVSAGAVLAYPGEFSFRAYRNGKIDLIQAQGIQEMIGARNQKSLKAAQSHLQGRLSASLIGIKQELLELAAVLDAWVDFPEEGLEFMSFEEMIEKLRVQKQKLSQLIDSYQTGQIVSQGAKLALVGEPNVGKSSLMNALLGVRRAIVTPIAGTTRDVIEDDLKLYDLSIRLKDTAGIRETDELVEQEGIKRSLESIQEADLVLFVKDASTPCSDKQRELIESLDPNKTLFIGNKLDQGCHLSADLLTWHYVSAKFDQGIESLKKTIYDKLMGGVLMGKEDELIMDQAQKQSLVTIVASIDQVIEGLQRRTSCEFIVLDLKEGLKALSALIGIDVTEDVLSALFSKFCVGK
jgi:tRNA modification GTPase